LRKIMSSFLSSTHIRSTVPRDVEQNNCPHFCQWKAARCAAETRCRTESDTNAEQIRGF
jgi:hypothetical protein